MASKYFDTAEALPPKRVKYRAILHGLEFYIQGGQPHEFDPEHCDICREEYEKDPDAFEVELVIVRKADSNGK